MSSFKEVFDKTVFQDGGPDAILNFSVISKLQSRKYNPTWKTLHETNQQNFCFLLWDSTKLSANGNPGWQPGRHLEYFRHLKNNIHENITLHGRLCTKQNSKFSAFHIEIWWNDQQNKMKDGCRTPSWIVQSFQKLHLRKYNPTWTTLQETNQQNFNSL